MYILLFLFRISGKSLRNLKHCGVDPRQIHDYAPGIVGKSGRFDSAKPPSKSDGAQASSNPVSAEQSKENASTPNVSIASVALTHLVSFILKHSNPKSRDPNAMLEEALLEGWRSVDDIPLRGEGEFVVLTISGLVRTARNRNSIRRFRRADAYGPKRATVVAVESGNYLGAVAWKPLDSKPETDGQT